MSTLIMCPECGQASELDAIRRGADEFCSHCDFPLFWARANLPTGSDAAAVDDSRRRLPGTAGRRTVGSRACPECHELNPLGNTHCIRCSAVLDPEPVVVVPEPLPPPPAPVVVVEPPPKRRWWPFVVLAAVAVVLVVTIVVALT
jgi:hypothetical protein